MSKSLIDKLLALKPQGRSVEEIAKELGEPAEKVKNLLEGKPTLPGDHQLAHWMNHLGEVNWQVLPPEKPEASVEPRAFRYLRASKGSYHRVFIPDDVLDEKGKPAKYIELFPFSDVHWGHKCCDKKNHNLDVKEVGKRPNRFAFLNGDNIENSLGDSAGGAAWMEQDAMPEQQVDQVTEVYRRIAHKIVVARPGNHEERSEKKTGINPLKIVCERLKIPYFAGPSNMEIIWRGYRWTFFMKHGTGGSNSPGGKLNNAGKDRMYTDFRNFFIMGHVHDEMTHKVVRSVRRRKVGPEGVEEFWVEYPKEYKVICPSYLLYDDTYAERAGYSPGSRNTIVIQLFANGDYHVVSSKRTQESSQVI